jgi:hypothetical protein
MALTRNQSIYGIHSVCPYNVDTFEPYGIFKVVGSMTLNDSQEQVPLQGGSSVYPWDIESGLATTDGSFLVREVPDFVFSAVHGATPTTGAAETGGGVTAIANLNGTSLVAATGLASVGVESGEEANVKTGIYMVKVVTSTTVDVYSLTDVDHLRGTDLTYQNDALKITASALTIATSTAVSIPNTGLELTGGAGTIGMTVGDTAWFDSRSINSSYSTATVGASGITKPNVGLIVAAQKKGNNEVFMLDIMKASLGGFPFNLAEKAWMESEVSFTASYNSTRNGVYRYIRVDGS